MDIIPEKCRVFYTNLNRAYPTAPIYLLLAIGTLGTNVARYSAVRRYTGHNTNIVPTGCSYKFLAPSRFGKGIVMRLITKLGNHVEKKQKTEHEGFVLATLARLPENTMAARADVRRNCSSQRPNLVFLTGGNGLQTQAMAAMNGGCGLIAVSEIKRGKCTYTDPDGKYGSLLVFYDIDIAVRTFRKADDIPVIDVNRIQTVAAGVKEDWVSFVQNSGELSGMMVRVLPILACDKDMVRLAYERLPHYPFSLDGLKEAFLVIEAQFANCMSTSETPPITFQFSESLLDSNFSIFKNNLIHNFCGHYNALLNNDPPSAAERKEERSGCSLLSVFLEQTQAEYQPLIRSSADDTFLRGLEENIHRLAGDFFWATFIPKYLRVHGNLLSVKKTQLERDVSTMLSNGGIVKIPQETVPHMFKLMTYILKGSFLLINLACPASHNAVDNTTSRNYML